MCVISYDAEYDDYYHEGSLIVDLELFVTTCLKAGKEIKFITDLERF